MSIYRRGRIWWIRLRHRGKRIRCSAGTSDRKQAQRKNDELAAQLWQERHTGKTFFAALALWLDEKPRSRNDGNAVKQIRNTYPDRQLSAVTKESILDAFGEKSPATYNRLLAVIRSALNLAVARGWLDTIPKLKKREVTGKRTRYLNADEWERLKAALPDHLREMAEFAVATGLRWSNVAYLEWSQVDTRRRIAWIHADQAKAGKDISVPLSDAAMTVLASRRGIDEVFVFTYRGSPIASPKTGWLKATEKAALDGLRWHDLRHTWASWHVMNGTPLAVLQELGGWSTAEMVKRYAHLAPGYTAQFSGNAKPVKIERTGHRRGAQKKDAA